MACRCTKCLYLSLFGKKGKFELGEFRFPIRTPLGDQLVAMFPIQRIA